MPGRSASGPGRGPNQALHLTAAAGADSEFIAPRPPRQVSLVVRRRRARMKEAEFDALVDESLAYMRRVIDDCNREWDFQSYQRWDIDLDRRVLVFSDGPRPPINCDIQ